jgi:ABC-type glycerol-3-phosphate transport system substrate-binding protein
MSKMARRLSLTFVDEGVTAIAELLENQAPKTCAAVIAALPQAGDAHHATYSGSEVAFILDRDLGIGRENATSKVIPGDLAYTRFDGGVMWGFPNDFSELCWFYDRDAVPSMPDGPVPVNIFGRFTEGFEEFVAVCRRMRREGVKRIEVKLI